ncbi:polysaccharide pyruvyl transferase family protein [Selenomonas ruminantium]|uniref:polysaccharide pyruvyl transferase family protein n=1 Tax=Selenomonas ruminantium TaxID=971 RepID=UPI0004190031|nr:polysaccharide pyruvyl transferase family protein [Selenomonas ruminantium]
MAIKYEDRNIFLFGMGINFFPYVDRLDRCVSIIGFVDNNPDRWGKCPLGDNRTVISPKELVNYHNPLVVIVSVSEKAVIEIINQCKSIGVEYCLVKDILCECFTDKYSYDVQWPERIQKEKIHRFIDLQLRDTTTCNFHCEYCYVWRRDGYQEGRKTSDFSPIQIRHALSLSRCGGACFVNICASGETLLSRDITQLVSELLAEGHYVSLVTNGTTTRKIKEILSLDKKYLERMFFKLSYHYFELQKRHLEDVFWRNVKLIAESPCSYTIEITPNDRLIPYIPKIKNIFQDKANGAMPHISFARDSTRDDFDLLSDLTIDDYEAIWGQFDSMMFSLKKKLYNQRISYFCYAGDWTFNISLQSGNLQTCYRQKKLYPFLSCKGSPIPVAPVGDKCAMRYCFNGHAFIAWGAIPELKCNSYLDMRDRVDNEGKHWIKPLYARAMKQKLYNNNFIYHNVWPDYEKLFAQNRKAAFILFNSPDYSNLGDHAIAVGERIFFHKYFPDVEFIQISCEEYILDNLKIKNVIQQDDILLISGGGYLGTLWPRFDDIVRHIISTYPHNTMFILPQTLFYENNSFGKQEMVQESRCFLSHKNLHLAFREKISYELAKDLFSLNNKISLVPDMALNIRFNKSKDRRGALLCFRKDKEAVNEYQCESEIISVLQDLKLSWKQIDTVVKCNVNMVERNAQVEKILDEFSGAEIVFTDRLHGMIFSAITGTPCLAFDNISKKITGSYIWLKEFNNIRVYDDKIDIKDVISELRSLNDAKNSWEDIDKHFYEYADFIKNEIGDVL